ncbi:MAG: methyltransferase domain-containing protein [Gemmatimonadaceae bacterium]
MTFRDLFSERASIYARFRPAYPAELFDWLRGLVERHDAVWDCATGNGQAARGLAGIFSRVVATDASAEQIEQASPEDSIEYRVADASDSGLPDQSVDMVTVAQALHWINRDTFYAEVRRVLKSDGAVVIWGYGDPVMETEPLEQIVNAYNRGTVEDYWMPERTILLDRYANVPFPFREIETPALTLERQWTLSELIGYLRTWSATANYIKKTGTDPIPGVEAELAEHWGGKENRRLVKWPLHIRAGYLS